MKAVKQARVAHGDHHHHLYLYWLSPMETSYLIQKTLWKVNPNTKTIWTNQRGSFENQRGHCRQHSGWGRGIQICAVAASRDRESNPVLVSVFDLFFFAFSSPTTNEENFQSRVFRERSRVPERAMMGGLGTRSRPQGLLVFWFWHCLFVYGSVYRSFKKCSSWRRSLKFQVSKNGRRNGKPWKRIRKSSRF